MNKWVTLSLVGFVISTELIAYLAVELIEHPDMSEIYFPIVALVIFSLAWIMSTGTLIYHIVMHCRESCARRREMNQDGNFPRWTHYQLQTAPPLVPATPSAPPLYDDD